MCSVTSARVRDFLAVFKYEPAVSNQLAFNAGDIIQFLREVSDGWWHGKCKGKFGNFPSNFVIELPPHWETTTRNFLALFKHESSEPNKLEFQMGDVIQFIIEMNNGWWFGKFNGKLGTFPSTFVKELSFDWDKSTRNFLALFKHESSEPNKLEFQMGDVIQFITEMNNGWLFGKFNGKLGTFPSTFVKEWLFDSDKSTRNFLALFKYEPLESNELAFQVGDIIQFISELQNGWWLGKFNGKQGIVPSNFVKELPRDWHRSTRRFKVHQSLNSQGRSKFCLVPGDIIEFVTDHDSNWFFGSIYGKIDKFPIGHVSEIFDELNPTSSKTARKGGITSVTASRSCLLDKSKKYLKATFPYEAGSTDELDLVVEDLIEFIEEVEEGWCRGRLLKNKKIGLFPLNFVTEVSHLETGIDASGQEASSTPTEMKHANQDFYQSDEIMSWLECCICLDLCTGKILQCKNGHNVCESHTVELQCCPTCRVEYKEGSSRNMLAERMVAKERENPAKDAI